MQSRLVLLAVMFGCSSAVGASTAAEDIHYQVDASVGRSDFTVGDATTYGLNGRLTVPLGQYLVASVFGGYSKSDFEASSASCGLNNGALGGGLFARTPTIGRIGTSYTRGRAESCAWGAFGTSTVTTDRDTYSVYAEYYLEPLTLRLTRERTEHEEWSAFDSITAEATWYPTLNASLGVSAEGLDAEDIYALRLEYQPALLGDSTSFSLRYVTGHDTDTIALGVSYFFDKRVALKTRDRQLR